MCWDLILNKVEIMHEDIQKTILLAAEDEKREKEHI